MIAHRFAQWLSVRVAPIPQGIVINRAALLLLPFQCIDVAASETSSSADPALSTTEAASASATLDSGGVDDARGSTEC